MLKIASRIDMTHLDPRKIYYWQRYLQFDTVLGIFTKTKRIFMKYGN